MAKEKVWRQRKHGNKEDEGGVEMKIKMAMCSGNGSLLCPSDQSIPLF